jgi:hypothetical protein
MRIFVGWPYDAKWVDSYVIPLIKSYESYGFEVVTGKELQGQALTHGVKKLIADADGTLFFTTRRERDQGNSWKTSDWVVDEIKHANSLNKEFVFEFREEGVEYPNKIHEERQHFAFSATDLMACLVELGKVINRWRGLNFRVKLAFSTTDVTLMERVRQRLRDDKKYKCSLSIRQSGVIVYGPKRTSLFREGDNVVLYTGELPAYTLAPGAVLEIDLEMGDELWSASRDSFTTLEVGLERL